jgi:hypothetical protein
VFVAPGGRNSAAKYAVFCFITDVLRLSADQRTAWLAARDNPAADRSQLPGRSCRHRKAGPGATQK